MLAKILIDKLKGLIEKDKISIKMIAGASAIDNLAG